MKVSKKLFVGSWSVCSLLAALILLYTLPVPSRLVPEQRCCGVYIYIQTSYNIALTFGQANLELKSYIRLTAPFSSILRIIKLTNCMQFASRFFVVVGGGVRTPCTWQRCCLYPTRIHCQCLLHNKNNRQLLLNLYDFHRSRLATWPCSLRECRGEAPLESRLPVLTMGGSNYSESLRPQPLIGTIEVEIFRLCFLTDDERYLLNIGKVLLKL